MFYFFHLISYHFYKSCKNMLRQTISPQLYEIPFCAICLLDMNNNICSLVCGHCFHRNCIQQHLSFRRTCPICRNYAQNRHMRNIYFDVVGKRKDSFGESGLMKEKMKQMEILLNSYEQGTLFLYEQINGEQQENMELRKEVEKLRTTVKQLELSAKIRQSQMKSLFKVTADNQRALMLELKVLKVMIKAKQEKERYRLGKENYVGRNGKAIIKDSSLSKRDYQKKEKGRVELRKSSSVPEIK